MPTYRATSFSVMLPIQVTGWYLIHNCFVLFVILSLQRLDTKSYLLCSLSISTVYPCGIMAVVPRFFDQYARPFSQRIRPWKTGQVNRIRSLRCRHLPAGAGRLPWSFSQAGSAPLMQRASDRSFHASLAGDRRKTNWRKHKK